MRVLPERFAPEDFGADSRPTDDSVMQRVMLHADVRLAPWGVGVTSSLLGLPATPSREGPGTWRLEPQGPTVRQSVDAVRLVHRAGCATSGWRTNVLAGTVVPTNPGALVDPGCDGANVSPMSHDDATSCADHRGLVLPWRRRPRVRGPP